MYTRTREGCAALGTASTPAGVVGALSVKFFIHIGARVTQSDDEGSDGDWAPDDGVAGTTEHAKDDGGVPQEFKEFLCEGCGKAFRKSSRLARHMVSHTGEVSVTPDVVQLCRCDRVGLCITRPVPRPGVCCIPLCCLAVPVPCDTASVYMSFCGL